MKSTNATLIAFLKNNLTFYYADLWTFTLANGTVLTYTSADINLTVSSVTYVADDVLISGGPKLSQSVGLTVNECDITLYPASSSMMGSIPFLTGVQNGLLYRAGVTVQRLFMATWGSTTLVPVTIFNGQITDIDATRNQVDLKCKDLINLLNIYMPRRQYQPTCSWTFGDANCGFDRTSVEITTTVGANSNGYTIYQPSLTQAAGYFNYGTVKATTGLNAGFSRSIKNSVSGILTLVAPFPSAFTTGDSITVTPGCTKNFAGPTQSFNAAASSPSTPNSIYCGLTNASGFFNNGTLQFTSGPNVGQSSVVSAWNQSGGFGIATLTSAMPNQPVLGDEFLITSISTNTQSSCTGYFGADAELHFGGQPFVPVPETAY